MNPGQSQSEPQVELQAASAVAGTVSSDADRAAPGERGGLYAGLRRVLSRPGADRAVIWLSLLLGAFCLDTGLAADDYIHAMVARGSTAIAGFVRHPLDMFSFTGGEATRLLMLEGVLSWWADPEAQLAFFRPVSSLTHYLDHQLWPGAPWLMHLHSLLWGALLLAGVLAVYRRLLGAGWVCALAVFLYALDDGRAWFGSWVAARNAAVATAISIWAFYFHIRARADGYGAGRIISPVLLAVALLAGEGAISICAYLFCYAVFLDERGSPVQRLLSIAPHAVVTLAWRAAYRGMGYGALKSGLYFDPVGDPLNFLGALAERGPVLLFSQIGGTWSDGWSAVFAFPVLHRLLILGSCFAVGLVGFALWPLWKSDRVVRFGVVGALLSVVPASPAFSADRLLTWVAIGACIAMARLIATYIDMPGQLTAAPLRALVLPPLMLWLVVSNAIIDPIFLPSRARGNVAMRDILDRAHAGVPGDRSIEGKHIVYINPAAVPLAAYIPIERAALGRPRARSQVWLATGETEVRVQRIDERTLRVRPRGGYLISPASHLARNPATPFEKGYSVQLSVVRIEVIALMADGRPAEIEARFDRPLEDPSLLWRRWHDVSHGPFEPPPVGQTLVLPASDYLRAVFGDAFELPFDGRLPAPHDPDWSEQGQVVGTGPISPAPAAVAYSAR
ncbi:MAG: hypothetical protein OEZ06_17680 [Myxococcales bacterium]|nr:hypothetical protein [Myxococcales bacterium]